MLNILKLHIENHFMYAHEIEYFIYIQPMRIRKYEDKNYVKEPKRDNNQSELNYAISLIDLIVAKIYIQHHKFTNTKRPLAISSIEINVVVNKI